eukprot:c22835_g1_i1 orf=1-1260(-)
MASLPSVALVFLLLVRLFICVASSSCPMDFSYVSSFKLPTCAGSTTKPSDSCCQAAFVNFGIGIALYLRTYQVFELADNATLYACYDAYQSSLSSKGLGGFSVRNCDLFNANSTHFIRSPTLCSGIETVNDWKTKVGTTAMDSSCKGDLSNSAVCQVCDTDVQTAIAKASNLSVNHSDCMYFGVLYAAGIINDLGPTNAATAYCLLAGEALSKSNHVVIYASVVGAAVVICAGCITAISVWLWCLRRKQVYHQKFVKRNKKLLSNSLHPNVGAIWYEFNEIKTATNNFSSNNQIGMGGFSTVYRGVMADGSKVAVKRIKNCTPEGDAEFGNEVEVINSVRHRKLVALRGCCVASNTSLGHLRLLIYDYMPNGSLEDYLFGGKKPVLEWPDRQRIALDAAQGITYLHVGVHPAIIHRDIKA